MLCNPILKENIMLHIFPDYTLIALDGNLSRRVELFTPTKDTRVSFGFGIFPSNQTL